MELLQLFLAERLVLGINLLFIPRFLLRKLVLHILSHVSALLVNNLLLPLGVLFLIQELLQLFLLIFEIYLMLDRGVHAVAADVLGIGAARGAKRVERRERLHLLEVVELAGSAATYIRGGRRHHEVRFDDSGRTRRLVQQVLHIARLLVEIDRAFLCRKVTDAGLGRARRLRAEQVLDGRAVGLVNIR